MREIFEIETFELRNSEWKSSYRGIKRLKEHEELLDEEQTTGNSFSRHSQKILDSSCI